MQLNVIFLFLGWFYVIYTEIITFLFMVVILVKKIWYLALQHFVHCRICGLHCPLFILFLSVTLPRHGTLCVCIYNLTYLLDIDFHLMAEMTTSCCDFVYYYCI